MKRGDISGLVFMIIICIIVWAGAVMGWRSIYNDPKNTAADKGFKTVIALVLTFILLAVTIAMGNSFYEEMQNKAMETVVGAVNTGNAVAEQVVNTGNAVAEQVVNTGNAAAAQIVAAGNNAAKQVATAGKNAAKQMAAAANAGVPK